MNRPAILLFAACVAGAGTQAIPAAAPAAPTRVVAQDLVKVRASNRVSAAIWTRRPGSYTLQLVLAVPDSAFGSRTLKLVSGRGIVATSAAPGAAAQAPKKPETSVWLLRADGTQIITRAPSTNPSPDKCNVRCNAIEVLYRFSIADATQAVAAAVRIGDDFYIEKLEPLEATQE